jgi:hypothetical protein
MLSIFQNTDEEELRKIDIKFRPSERAIAYSKEQRTLEALKKGETLPKTKKPKATKTKVEVIEVIEEGVSDEKQATMLLIADLEEALEYMDSEEQTNTQGLIDDLKEALDFM